MFIFLINSIRTYIGDTNNTNAKILPAVGKRVSEFVNRHSFSGSIDKIRGQNFIHLV